MLKFLADMPVSMKTVAALKTMGYDIEHLRERGMQRARDTEILQMAIAEGRVILTMDLGFGTLLAHSGQVCPGLIIFRLHLTTPARVNAALASLLDTASEEDIVEHILVIEESRVRTHPLPI